MPHETCQIHDQMERAQRERDQRLETALKDLAQSLRQLADHIHGNGKPGLTEMVRKLSEWMEEEKAARKAARERRLTLRDLTVRQIAVGLGLWLLTNGGLVALIATLVN